LSRAFIWDEWNEDHIAKHGIDRAEAQHVIERKRPPFPRDIGDGKYLVHGQTEEGRYLQVIYSLRSTGEIDYESMTLEDIIALPEDDRPAYYVVHASDLTTSERHGLRRKRP